MRTTWALAFCLVILPACARGGGGDRIPFDAGTRAMDAAFGTDAGFRQDAGFGTDAGFRQDAGFGSDAALGTDAGCTSSCVGLECGDDGCGGTCGSCTTGTCASGTCSCTPNCTGRTCGDDGCGGSCGTCGSLCTDTCAYSLDFDCDDGGPFSDYSLCDLGTDCFDCGPRTAVCSSGTCVSP